MNDAERFRQLLFEKAGEPTTSVRLPDAVLRRSRLRQLRTIAGGFLASVAVVGLVAVQIGRRDTTTPADRPTGVERTVWIAGARISAPASWYLIDRWGSPTEASDPPGEQPLVQLTSWDPGLDRSICGAAIPDDGVALYVGLERHGDSSDPAPVWPTVVGDDTPISDGPCGAGRYVRFRPWDRTLFAWIGTGTNADPVAKHELFDRFNDMRVDPWPDEDATSFTEPTYVVAGEAGQDPVTRGWKLEVRPSGLNIELILDAFNGGSISDFTDLDQSTSSPQVCCAYGPRDTSDPVFGAVAEGVRGVRWIPLGDESPTDATILSLPPTMPFDLDIFFAPNPANVNGRTELIAPIPATP